MKTIYQRLEHASYVFLHSLRAFLFMSCGKDEVPRLAVSSYRPQPASRTVRPRRSNHLNTHTQTNKYTHHTYYNILAGRNSIKLTDSIIKQTSFCFLCVVYRLLVTGPDGNTVALLGHLV